MELRLGQYLITQRTPYSKMCIYDFKTNKDITADNKSFLEGLLSEYNEQIKSPDDYFIIDKDELVGLSKIANNKFTDIFVPSTIKKISFGAFKEKELFAVHLPDTIQLICKRAFQGCTNLEGIYLPDSIEDISVMAFDKCNSLEYVRLPSNIIGLWDNTFSNCYALKSIDIPDSVEDIADNVFQECRSLTDIKLPKNLKSLGQFVFGGCKNLETIDLPESLQTIDVGCFDKCISLREVIMPDSIQAIGAGIFRDCVNLVSVKLSENIMMLPSDTFENCKRLKDLVLPDTIEMLDNCIFNGAYSLKSINIPEKLRVVRGAPFANSGITTLIINHDLQDIDFNLDLLYDTNICKLVINSSVKTIIPDAFAIAGSQITQMEYMGTEDEFREFMENNKTLFALFTDLKNINFSKFEKSIRQIMER